jgi:hypothetical protein
VFSPFELYIYPPYSLEFYGSSRQKICISIRMFAVGEKGDAKSMLIFHRNRQK